MLKLGVSRPAILAMALFMLAFAQKTASAEPRATEFKLSNGMDVVVIPDHRAPVVTHMVWYKVGAADEPKGVSGIAHFLEHLMFKSTDKIAVGDFPKSSPSSAVRTTRSPDRTSRPTISASPRTNCAP